MFLPMSLRLSDEDQQKIDAVWNNMLTPVNRVEHETLLDVTVSNWLYQWGVDRLHFVSEKYLPSGKVVMEIDCDRANPAADQFTITVLNDRGQTIRRERYSRAEVDESAKMLWNASKEARGPAFALKSEVSVEITIGSATQPANPPTPGPTTQPAETPEEKQFREARERRLKAMEAATQPAVLRHRK
jgi:hypothetical protein